MIMFPRALNEAVDISNACNIWMEALPSSAIIVVTGSTTVDGIGEGKATC